MWKKLSFLTTNYFAWRTEKKISTKMSKGSIRNLIQHQPYFKNLPHKPTECSWTGNMGFVRVCLWVNSVGFSCVNQTVGFSHWSKTTLNFTKRLFEILKYVNFEYLKSQMRNNPFLWGEHSRNKSLSNNFVDYVIKCLK